MLIFFFLLFNFFNFGVGNLTCIKSRMNRPSAMQMVNSSFHQKNHTEILGFLKSPLKAIGDGELLKEGLKIKAGSYSKLTDLQQAVFTKAQ